MPAKRSSINRRQFFARSAVAAGATTLGGGLFDALVARAYAGHPHDRPGAGYGPLRPAGDDLALPAGFHYRVISNEGDPMDDGFPAPKAMSKSSLDAAAFIISGTPLVSRTQVFAW